MLATAHVDRPAGVVHPGEEPGPRSSAHKEHAPRLRCRAARDAGRRQQHHITAPEGSIGAFAAPGTEVATDRGKATTLPVVHSPLPITAGRLTAFRGRIVAARPVAATTSAFHRALSACRRAHPRVARLPAQEMPRKPAVERSTVARRSVPAGAYVTAAQIAAAKRPARGTMANDHFHR
jgi:hypothetical protein